MKNYRRLAEMLQEAEARGAPAAIARAKSEFDACAELILKAARSQTLLRGMIKKDSQGREVRDQAGYEAREDQAIRVFVGAITSLLEQWDARRDPLTVLTSRMPPDAQQRLARLVGVGPERMLKFLHDPELVGLRLADGPRKAAVDATARMLNIPASVVNKRCRVVPQEKQVAGRIMHPSPDGPLAVWFQMPARRAEDASKSELLVLARVTKVGK